MQLTFSRILSLVIAIAYGVALCARADQLTVKHVFAFVIGIGVALALIWFPDEVGDATGYMAGHMMRVDRPTPPVLVSIMGWFFLVGLPLAVWLIKLLNS
jgi:hypothetical protein